MSGMLLTLILLVAVTALVIGFFIGMVFGWIVGTDYMGSEIHNG